MTALSIEQNGKAGQATRRRPRLVLALIAALLALPLGTAARHSRPAPYGDRLSVHAPDRPAARYLALRTNGQAVEAYERGSGRHRGGRTHAKVAAPVA